MGAPKFEAALTALEAHGVVKKRSNYYEARCPVHPGAAGLNLHLMMGDEGGAKMVCHSNQCDYWAIVAALGLGDDHYSGSSETRSKTTPPSPASKPVETHETARYRIPIAEGDVVEHVRLDGIGSDGKPVKEFRFERNGRSGLDGLPSKELPLYNVDILASGTVKHVVVTEGEKACDALTRALIHAVGTACGANVIPDDKALLPLLGVGTVLLWADNDRPGRQHMDAIAERLKVMGHPDVRRVDWINAPDKGDASDAIAGGIDIIALLDATVVPPTPYESARKRLGLRSVADWIDEPEVPIEYLVDGLLAREALTMLCAFPKAGKSVFARHMTYSVATGTPFLGRETTQGTVIYAALEEMEGQVKNAFRKMGVTKDTQLHLKFGRANEHFVEDLRLCVEVMDASLVVVDTFVRIPRKKNPESSDYFGSSELLQPLLDMAHETGAAVLPLYHTTKAGKSAEGYEAISAVMMNAGIVSTIDQLISIVVQSDDTRGFQSYGRLEAVPVTLYSFDRETEALALLGTKEEVTHQTVRAAVMDACAVDAWITTADLKDNVEHSGAAVTKAIKELRAEGKLEQQGAGKSGSPYEYRRV
jgi:KaiC/GvpD/RAD55 family RecA-like ATPase